MADFLTRLAERTLGVAPVAQPITASMFANGQTVGNAPSVAEGFTVQNEVEALAAPQTPTVRPARPSQSAQPAPPGLTARVNPTIDGAPQNPHAISRAEPSYQEPATMVKGSMLPGVDVDSHEEQRYPPLRQGDLAKVSKDLSASISHVGNPLVNDQESLVLTEHVAMPDQQAAKVEEMGPGTGIDEVNLLVIVPQSATAQVQRANRPLVSERLIHRQEGLASPIDADAPGEHIERRDTSIALGGEIVQDGQPGGTSLGDVVTPRLRSIKTQNNSRQLVGLDSAQQGSTPTPIQQQQQDNLLPERQILLVPEVQVVSGVKQQQETSSRQQAGLAPTNEQSGNPADQQRQLQPSLLQNRQVATSQHLSAPVSEAASSTPTIRVTIGRIDVRAITPPAPPPRPKQARPGPTLSLDDYARQRKGGER